MSKYWIVAADQSKARIFSVDDPHGELQELEQLEHPVGRDQAQTLGSDRPGRSYDSSGRGRALAIAAGAALIIVFISA